MNLINQSVFLDVYISALLTILYVILVVSHRGRILMLLFRVGLEKNMYKKDR